MLGQDRVWFFLPGMTFGLNFCPLAMTSSPLRVLLVVDDLKLAAALAAPLREAGYDEIILVEARGDAALKAARLVHPDLVVLSGPLRGTLNGVALAAALQEGHAAPVPVVLVTDPAELPSLLALQAQSTLPMAKPNEPNPSDAAFDASLEEAEA